MSKYDIVITFFTIIYGLMLTDLFSSFHKLIRARQKVKWHWLPLLAAWYLFLIILKNWWVLYAFHNPNSSINIYFFIAYGHLLLILFLLVSTALPDIIEEKGVELKSYYFQNHKYFWGLMTLTVLLSNSINFFKKINNLGQVELFQIIIPILIFLSLLLVLTFSKKYLVHSVLLILFVVETIFEIISKGFE